MAKSIKRVPFPDFLCKTPCKINLDGEGLTEDGQAAVYKNGIETLCIYSAKSKRTYDKDGKSVVVSGTVIVKGDIAPGLKAVSSGSVVINGREMRIYAGHRPLNPDGSVHHTEFELI